MVDVFDDGNVYDRARSPSCLGKIIRVAKKTTTSSTIRVSMEMEKNNTDKNIQQDTMWDFDPESSEDSAKLEGALLDIPHLNVRG